MSAPYLTYHRADAGGELTVTRPIHVAAPTMISPAGFHGNWLPDA
ncbi:hypothetical protein [Actinacidiphila oryziradicis]|nr:hypothetical protein [Actinacidiphila oryziradicis]